MTQIELKQFWEAVQVNHFPAFFFLLLQWISTRVQLIALFYILKPVSNDPWTMGHTVAIQSTEMAGNYHSTFTFAVHAHPHPDDKPVLWPSWSRCPSSVGWGWLYRGHQIESERNLTIDSDLQPLLKLSHSIVEPVHFLLEGFRRNDECLGPQRISTVWYEESPGTVRLVKSHH